MKVTQNDDGSYSVYLRHQGRPIIVEHEDRETAIEIAIEAALARID